MIKALPSNAKFHTVRLCLIQILRIFRVINYHLGNEATPGSSLIRESTTETPSSAQPAQLAPNRKIDPENCTKNPATLGDRHGVATSTLVMGTNDAFLCIMFCGYGML